MRSRHEKDPRGRKKQLSKRSKEAQLRSDGDDDMAKYLVKDEEKEVTWQGT